VLTVLSRLSQLFNLLFGIRCMPLRIQMEMAITSGPRHLCTPLLADTPISHLQHQRLIVHPIININGAHLLRQARYLQHQHKGMMGGGSKLSLGLNLLYAIDIFILLLLVTYIIGRTHFAYIQNLFLHDIPFAIINAIAPSIFLTSTRSFPFPHLYHFSGI